MSITNYPTIGATGAAVDRQVFEAAGTWIKPTGGQTVTRVQLLAAGGGGAGGGNGATGSFRFGGAGGAAGAYIEAWYATSELPASVAIAIGTGGTGGTGTALAAISQIGNPGATGGNSTFGTLLRAFSQVFFGATGQTAQAPPLGGIGAMGSGQGGQSGVTGSARHFGGLCYQPNGGAQGVGIFNTGVPAGSNANGNNNMAMDDWANVALVGSGTGISSPGGNATLPPNPVKTLADVKYGVVPWYTGAGGGPGPGGITGPATGPGGNGCDGAGYGSGGGGGGGSTLATGGIGGRGAPGLAIITSY